MIVSYRDGYENSAIVKRYDEKNYLAIYNIKYQDEVVVFTTVFQNLISTFLKRNLTNLKIFIRMKKKFQKIFTKK